MDNGLLSVPEPEPEYRMARTRSFERSDNDCTNDEKGLTASGTTGEHDVCCGGCKQRIGIILLGGKTKAGHNSLSLPEIVI